MSNRAPKLSNLLLQIQKAVIKGTYRDTYHSGRRYSERLITRPEVEYVLLNGWHERRKDYFDEQYKAWNYSIRGNTVDKRDLRIVVSFDTDGMLIITAIDIGA